jgi:hypothetical protein
VACVWPVPLCICTYYASWRDVYRSQQAIPTNNSIYPKSDFRITKHTPWSILYRYGAAPPEKPHPPHQPLWQSWRRWAQTGEFKAGWPCLWRLRYSVQQRQQPVRRSPFSDAELVGYSDGGSAGDNTQGRACMRTGCAADPLHMPKFWLT